MAKVIGKMLVFYPFMDKPTLAALLGFAQKNFPNAFLAPRTNRFTNSTEIEKCDEILILESDEDIIGKRYRAAGIPVHLYRSDPLPLVIPPRFNELEKQEEPEKKEPEKKQEEEPRAAPTRTLKRNSK